MKPGGHPRSAGSRTVGYGSRPRLTHHRLTAVAVAFGTIVVTAALAQTSSVGTTQGQLDEQEAASRRRQQTLSVLIHSILTDLLRAGLPIERHIVTSLDVCAVVIFGAVGGGNIAVIDCGTRLMIDECRWPGRTVTLEPNAEGMFDEGAIRRHVVESVHHARLPPTERSERRVQRESMKAKSHPKYCAAVEVMSLEGPAASFDPRCAVSGEYLAGLKCRILDGWVYPREAVRERLTGQGELSFVVRMNGAVGAIEIRRSSGAAILDRSIEYAIRSSSPFPPIQGRIPWSIPQKRLQVTITYTYRLDGGSVVTELR